MEGKYMGTLVGYHKYDKVVKDDNGVAVASKPQHVYEVLIRSSKRDKVTGLCLGGSKVISVIEEEQVLKTMTNDMPVTVMGETMEYRDKNGMTLRISYYGIEAVQK